MLTLLFCIVLFHKAVLMEIVNETFFFTQYFFFLRKKKIDTFCFGSSSSYVDVCFCDVIINLWISKTLLMLFKKKQTNKEKPQKETEAPMVEEDSLFLFLVRRVNNRHRVVYLSVDTTFWCCQSCAFFLCVTSEKLVSVQHCLALFLRHRAFHIIKVAVKY